MFPDTRHFLFHWTPPGDLKQIGENKKGRDEGGGGIGGVGALGNRATLAEPTNW